MIYYGESKEEALDTEHCETMDILSVQDGTVIDLALRTVHPLTNDCYMMESSKAFRYVYVVCDEQISVGKVSMQYEYMPETYRGSFQCDNDLLNRIWEIGAYTMHLTTREFFIDGIKRDRWVWSGDAIQNYLMNYYLFFDSETVKRTIWQLRGKDPVTSHINTIMDYTFYWFLSVYDYYMYTGDEKFVKQLYPRMKSLMEYVLGRTDSDGMVQGMTGDWVFVDWADGYLDKKDSWHSSKYFSARVWKQWCSVLALPVRCKMPGGMKNWPLLYERNWNLHSGVRMRRLWCTIGLEETRVLV